jgi:DNA polymerase-1
MVECDTETRGLQWYYEPHGMFMAQFYDGDEVAVLRHPQDREEIQRRLLAADGIRGWNWKFDAHHIEQAGYTLPPEHTWEDGMVLAHIIDERQSAALKARAASVVGEEARDSERKVKDWLQAERRRRRAEAKEANAEYVAPTYADVPSSIMDWYAAEDVQLQRQVCSHYERNLPDSLRAVYEMERGVLAALFHVEKRGIPIDRDAAAALEARMLDDLEVLETRCIDLAGIPHFNPNSPGQVIEALKRRGADLTFVGNTPGGQPSTDNENLSAVDDELAAAILEFRGVQKMVGTYLRPMLHGSEDSFGPKAPFIAPDGRIHPNFRQVGARTARMSCEGPNIQNWHRDDLRLRHLVRATEGKVLVQADLDKIELRLFAAFAGNGPLRQAVKAGDLYSEAADAAGIRDAVRAGGFIEPARQRGKRFVLGILYGMGVRGLRRHLRVPQNDARVMLDRFHFAYPEVGNLQDTIEIKLRSRGYVETPWGRRHRIDPRDAYKATAALVQGTAADLIKDSLVRIHKRGVPVVGIYHDEILAEVDKADAEEAKRIIVEELTTHERITRVIPLEADATICDRWSHAKDPNYGEE